MRYIHPYIILVLSIAFLVMFFFVETVPPDGATQTEMVGIAVRMAEYMKAHNKLAEHIADLPSREGHGDSINDAWGNKIVWNGDETEIILRSFGKDGKLGGKGENSDIVLSFDPRKPSEMHFSNRED